MHKNIDIKELVHKYISGKSNAKELDKAIEIFKDPHHNLDLQPTLFEEWNIHKNDMENDLHQKDFNLILDKIHHEITPVQESNSRKYSCSIIYSFLKVAAILIVGFISGYNINEFFESQTESYCTFIAPEGAISKMILPDNTLVTLNAGSQLKYSINNKVNKREVFLAGEAWFDVSENKEYPFVVHTPFYQVKVLGTQFNIKAYNTEEEITTTLVKGRIQIFSDIFLKNKKSILLNPGEQLVYNRVQKKAIKSRVDTRLYTSWKDNKLIFINMNLNDLIVLLERRYKVDIEVEDNIVLDYHYDGTIKDESIIEVLDMLKETLPIKYRIIGQKIIIHKK